MHPLPRQPRAKPENLLPGQRYAIDPVAFFLALVLAPLYVTALSFWMFLVPVGALIFGGPVYLVLGTPVLLWHLAHHPAQPDRIAGLAMATVAIAAIPALAALALLQGWPRNPGSLLLIGAFALVFAGLWGAAFGWLYPKFRKDFYATPI